MILEPAPEYLLFEFLDFDMDALNVYDHVSFQYLNSCPCPEFMTLDLVHLNMLEGLVTLL